MSNDETDEDDYYGEEGPPSVRFVSQEELDVLKKSIDETNKTNEALRTMVTDTNSQLT